MFRTSYTRKCGFLFGALLLFFFLAFKFSVSETLKNRSEIKEKEEKIVWLKEKENEVPFLLSKTKQIESICNKEDSVAIRDQLTAFISDFAEGNECTVTEIPSAQYYKTKDNIIETNYFTVKGKFNYLLKLEQALEKKFKLVAKVMSVHFYTIKDGQSKRKSLYVRLTTQSINKMNSYENN